MRFRSVLLMMSLILAFTMQVSAASGSSMPNILVYKGSEVTLSVKVTNTGKAPLEGVRASLDFQSQPEWIQPVVSLPKTVSIPAATSANERSFGNVDLQFRVNELAEAGESILLPFEITDRDGTIWKRFVRLNIQEKPTRTALFANYPNPFNPETWIPYQLNKAAEIRLQIYNTSGRLVRTIDVAYQEAGVYLDKDRAIYWNGKNDAGETLASGIYFYSLRAGDLTETRRMLLLK